ncbi:MAG: hypothetical protein R3E85_03795 [Planctomycetota bacterium]
MPEQDVRHYVLGHVAAVWAAAGHEVVTLDDPARHRDADVAVLHVDLTYLPAAWRTWATRFPYTINGKAVDAAKSLTSTLRVDRDDTWDGPVIVKTDLNYGGVPEQQLARARLRRAAEGRGAFARHRARRAARRLAPVADPAAYPVHPHRDAVPDHIWDDPTWVVERFVPERSGDDYVLHKAWFLGERSLTWRAYADRPLVKGRWIRRREVVPTDPRIDAWRRLHGLDFGKVEYVTVNGRPEPVDLNPTPGTGSPTLPSGLPPLVESLAPGLEDLPGADDGDQKLDVTAGSPDL